MFTEKVNKELSKKINNEEIDSLKKIIENSKPFEIFAQDTIIKIYPCMLTEKGNYFMQEKKKNIFKWILISFIPFCAFIISIISLFKDKFFT